MITRNWTFNGVSLSDSLSATQRVVVQSVTHSVVLELPQRDLPRGGTVTGTPTPKGRLFSFSGVIFGATEAQRATGQAIINALVAPNETGKTLTWQDDTGGSTVYSVTAKVSEMPKYKHDLAQPIIEFSFELFSDSPVYFGATNTASGSTGSYGGMTLPNTFPFTLSGVVGGISVTNAGSTFAFPKITVTGSALNPVVGNASTGDFYRVVKTTSLLVVDSENLAVTDAGTDCTQFRGERSIFPTLSPGANTILVMVQSGTPTVTVSWKDTFIHSGI